MDDISEIRQRKIEQLQAQAHQQREEMQQIAALEEAVKQYFTSDALIRFGNLKTAHPEQAVKALVLLSKLLRAGKVQKVDSETLKSVLRQLQPREITITRK